MGYQSNKILFKYMLILNEEQKIVKVIINRLKIILSVVSSTLVYSEKLVVPLSVRK